MYQNDMRISIQVGEPVYIADGWLGSMGFQNLWILMTYLN